MCKLARLCADEVVEHQHNAAIIIMGELLHLGIHAGALRIIGLGARLDEEAATSPGSKLSARSGTMLPFASTSVRLFDIAPQKTHCVNVSGYPAGSSVSVVAPWASPKRAEPPCFGAARAVATNKVSAAAAVRPAASPSCTKSRREMRPFLASARTSSNLLLCSDI